MTARRKRLLDLLDQWRDLAEQGRDVPAAELCANDPDLIDDLAKQIRFVRGVERQADPFPPRPDLGKENPALLPPPTIPGYDILELLGQGGMGAVYKARDQKLERLVALKVIKEGRVSPEVLARFRTEARALARSSEGHRRRF